MYIHLHGLAQPSDPMPNPLAPSPTPPTPRACNDKGIPPFVTTRPFTAKKVKCAKRGVFGVTDPAGVISTAVARAVKMLDKTIGELVNARSRVCQGETPAQSLCWMTSWLRNGLSVNIDDIRVWTAGTFVNRSVAEVIRRLMRVRNLIASNVIRYVCGGRCDPADPASGCVSGDWAFVCMPDPCPPGVCADNRPSLPVLLGTGLSRRRDASPSGGPRGLPGPDNYPRSVTPLPLHQRF